MNILEKEFVMNADSRGNNTFRQVKRNEYGAIYQRFNMDGKPLEYEVFQIKIAGGVNIFEKHYDKYEQYPGKSAFGKTAWSTLKLETAEKIFQEITDGKGKRFAGQALDAPIPVKLRKAGGKRGRPRVIRPAVVFPKKKFSIKNLLKLNPKPWTQPTLYVELMKLVKENKVKEVSRKSMGKGRATVFYEVIA